MEKKQSFLSGLTDRMGLPGEAMPGVSVAELWGKEKVLVDHHGGVIAYSPEEIQVRVSYGLLKISGSDLQMSRMTGQQLIISGHIQSLTVEEARL